MQYQDYTWLAVCHRHQTFSLINVTQCEEKIYFVSFIKLLIHIFSLIFNVICAGDRAGEPIISINQQYGMTLPSFTDLTASAVINRLITDKLINVM